jgi:hypothetical protein
LLGQSGLLGRIGRALVGFRPFSREKHLWLEDLDLNTRIWSKE